jgi:DhnA family fructose-bisphosphate aldolase class Ia
MGRNIWQADDPARMVSMMRGIVHDGQTAEEVLEAGG